VVFCVWLFATSGLFAMDVSGVSHVCGRDLNCVTFVLACTSCAIDQPPLITWGVFAMNESFLCGECVGRLLHAAA